MLTPAGWKSHPITDIIFKVVNCFSRVYHVPMLRILFIGGTGNISTSVSRLCVDRGYQLTLLNRGKSERIEGTETLVADINDPAAVAEALGSRTWDAVVDWIAFTPDDVKRDIELFSGRTGQYIFISSASAYQKPSVSPFITESTPLVNPFWDYSRKKAECERILMEAFDRDGFPVTIVRPSHTYRTKMPLPVGGGSEYTAVDRIKKGLPVICHGDGTSLWVLTHSDDFARGFTGLLGNCHAIGNAFHITSDEVLTWNQIYTEIGKAVGREPVIVYAPTDVIAAEDSRYIGELWGDKAWSVIFDNSKVKSLVPDFICTVPFSVGIRRTLAWFEEKPERMIISEETNRLIDRIAARMGKALE